MPRHINNLSLFWYLLLHICFLHITWDLGFMCPIILMHWLEMYTLELLQNGWRFHRLPHKENQICFSIPGARLLFSRFEQLNWMFFHKILLTNISLFSFTDGFCNVIFHNYRHADKPCYCPPAPAAGKVVLQIIMAVFCCCFYCYWAASHRTGDSLASL